VRISAPPVKWPCFYGIDFASKAELIANGLDDEGIRASIGADSLGYLALDSLIAASEQPRSRLCTACFDGHYPIPLPEEMGGKHVLEGIGRSVAGGTGSGGSVSGGSDHAPANAPAPGTPAEQSDPSPQTVQPVQSAWAAEDALSRP